MGHRRYLFLDDSLIAQSDGVRRNFHVMQKEAGNPVLLKKYDWEGSGPGSPSTMPADPPYVLWTGGFKVTETSAQDGRYLYPASFMRSEDGINWSDRFYSNATDIDDDDCQSCAAIYDEGHNFGDYKYLGMAIYRHVSGMEGASVQFVKSEDGFHWEHFSDRPWWHGPSDIINFFWDANLKKYVAYFKMWKLAGITQEGQPFCMYGPGFGSAIEGDIFHAYGSAVLPERIPFDVRLRYMGSSSNNDGGGGVTDESLTMIRVIGRAESPDFLHWTEPQIIIEPQDGAPLGDQTYGLCVRPYYGYYLGMYNRFNSVTGLIDPMLAWSADGVNYNIRWDEPVIPLGGEGDWDCGMLFPSTLLEDGAGRVFVYYGAQNVPHYITDSEKISVGIGRAWLRQDGFASLSGGRITTVPLVVTQPELTVNMKGIVHLTLKTVDGDTVGTAQLRGDHHRLLADMDLTGVLGQSIVIEMDLSRGELFSLAV